MNGQRIVVTRAADQAAELAERLRDGGAEPLLYPCIEIAAPLDQPRFDAALHAASRGRCEALILTSANSALALSRRMIELGLDPTLWSRCSVFAVGPATAAAAQRLLAATVERLPEAYLAESLVARLPAIPGMALLLLHDGTAPSELARTLVLQGYAVTAVAAYRTVLSAGGIDLPALLAAHQIDAITLTSPSIVRYFLARMALHTAATHLLDDVCIACLGPTTAQVARTHGLPVSVIPPQYTLSGLVAAIAHYFDVAQQRSRRVATEQRRPTAALPAARQS